MKVLLCSRLVTCCVSITTNSASPRCFLACFTSSSSCPLLHPSPLLRLPFSSFLVFLLSIAAPSHHHRSETLQAVGLRNVFEKSSHQNQWHYIQEDSCLARTPSTFLRLYIFHGVSYSHKELVFLRVVPLRKSSDLGCSYLFYYFRLLKQKKTFLLKD